MGDMAAHSLLEAVSVHHQSARPHRVSSLSWPPWLGLPVLLPRSQSDKTTTPLPGCSPARNGRTTPEAAGKYSRVARRKGANNGPGHTQQEECGHVVISGCEERELARAMDWTPHRAPELS